MATPALTPTLLALVLALGAASAAPLRSILTTDQVPAPPLQCNNASAILVGRFYGSAGYSIVRAESAQECCGLCASAVGECQSWTFGHEDSKCHLKSEPPSTAKLGHCQPPCAAGPAPSFVPPAPPPAPVPPQPPNSCQRPKHSASVPRPVAVRLGWLPASQPA